jgi:hypothetical protein
MVALARGVEEKEERWRKNLKVCGKMVESSGAEWERTSLFSFLTCYLHLSFIPYFFNEKFLIITYCNKPIRDKRASDQQWPFQIDLSLRTLMAK